jgi:hypothetical protein
MFWVISVYFNIRNTLPKSGTFLLGHPVYCTMHMHVPENVKFVNVQQAKQIYQYKNTKEKLYKTNAAIWYNKTCRQKYRTPNYISVKNETFISLVLLAHIYQDARSRKCKL